MKKQLINLEPIKEQVRTKLLDKYDNTLYMNTSTIDVRIDIKEILEEYIKEKNLVEPRIYITADAYIKMRKLVDDTSTEVGWYGTVSKVPGLTEVYVIEDILVYPQIVTGGTCVQDDDKVFEFELSLTNEQVNMKRFHGHSHVNMGTTPSGVDEQFYQDLLSQVRDYFITTVTNKSGSYTTRFYDIENNILYTDVDIQVITNTGQILDEWYETEKDKLKEHTYTSNFKGSVLDEDYKKTYKNPYQYLEEEDNWFEFERSFKKKGRPKKGK